MARIVLGSYMVRYPLGGMMSWVLQYITGFLKLGHEVFFVEKYGFPNSCFNPITQTMSDDCSYGTQLVAGLLSRFDLNRNWCFVSRDGKYYGLSKTRIEEVFRTADLFIDMGTHGSWAEEAFNTPLKVLLDGEPGYTQIRMINNQYGAINQLNYDLYFTNGMNIGTDMSNAPHANITWGHLLHPVDTDIIQFKQPNESGAFSTIMNWRSHNNVEFNGKSFGQKDVEFQKFIHLPGLVKEKMEVAVSGKDVPYSLLHNNSWNIVDGYQVTLSYDSFLDYIQTCKGEFSVCKNVFVANKTGWFSDKSGVFLAMGRPVILQDTGFSDHLPCGKGLFAFNNLAEAIDAIEQISSDFYENSKAARQIACENLEASKVLVNFLYRLGL